MALFALIGVAGLSIFLTSRPPNLSVTAPRDLEGMQQLLEQTGAPKSSSHDSGSLLYSNSVKGLVITHSRGAPPVRPFFGYTMQEALAGEPLGLGEGSITLDLIGVAFPSPALAEENTYNERTPASFYTPDLKPAQEEHVAARLKTTWDRELSTQLPAPTFCFYWRGSNAPPLIVLNAETRDARTGFVVNRGGSVQSSYGQGGGFYYGMELNVWHKTPILLAMDVGHGPVQTNDFSPNIGTKIPHQLGSLTLVFATNAPNRGLSTTIRNAVAETTFVVRKEAPGCSFVFSGAPTLLAPVELEFIDDSGQRLGISGNMTSGSLRVYTVAGSLEKVAKIRAKHYPHLKRLVTKLPYLPGLPAENHNVTDLLDVRIPFAHGSGSALGEIIQAAGQTELVGFAPAYPPPPARSYTNVTVGTLLAEVQAAHTSPHRLTIKEGVILFRPPLLKELLQRLLP